MYDELLQNGLTHSSFNYSKTQQSNIIGEIQSYVKAIGAEFIDILRMNQAGDRYHFVGFIISKPQKKSLKYADVIIIGLIYEDKKPEKGVLYKQDFIIKMHGEYFFVVGEGWKTKFPNLKKFSRCIWSYKKFDGEIANELFYKENGKFNHYYKSLEQLPLEFQNSLNSNFPSSPKSPLPTY